jgi:hypothetical protein
MSRMKCVDGATYYHSWPGCMNAFCMGENNVYVRSKLYHFGVVMFCYCIIFEVVHVCKFYKKIDKRGVIVLYDPVLCVIFVRKTSNVTLYLFERKKTSFALLTGYKASIDVLLPNITTSLKFVLLTIRYLSGIFTRSPLQAAIFFLGKKSGKCMYLM